MAKMLSVREYEAKMDDSELDVELLDAIAEEMGLEGDGVLEWADYAEDTRAAISALSPEEQHKLNQLVVETQIHARVGSDHGVRECHCRIMCGGIAQCGLCQLRQEAM